MILRRRPHPAIPDPQSVSDRQDRRHRDRLHQFRGLHAGGGRLADHLPGRRHRRRQAGADAPAIDRRDRPTNSWRRHAALDRRLGRHEVLPLRVHDLHVRADAEHDRADPLCLHRHQPHHRHRRARAHGVLHRADLRADPPRPAFLQPVRAQGRADLHPAADRGDRDPVVHLAADLAQRASVRQHAGRPHHAAGVRQLHHPARQRRSA